MPTMIDPTERARWFDAFYAEALKIGIAQREARAWAKSMAAIAEQFAPNNDSEDAEPELV